MFRHPYVSYATLLLMLLLQSQAHAYWLAVGGHVAAVYVAAKSCWGFTTWEVSAPQATGRSRAAWRRALLRFFLYLPLFALAGGVLGMLFWIV